MAREGRLGRALEERGPGARLLAGTEQFELDPGGVSEGEPLLGVHVDVGVLELFVPLRIACRSRLAHSGAPVWMDQTRIIGPPPVG